MGIWEEHGENQSWSLKDWPALKNFCFVVPETIWSSDLGLTWLLLSESSPCWVPFIIRAGGILLSMASYRHQWVLSESYDCPTAGNISKCTLSIKDVDRVPILSPLVFSYEDYS